MEAIALLETMLQEDEAVFRYTPTEAVALNSMFKENFKEDNKLKRSRITLEVSVFIPKKGKLKNFMKMKYLKFICLEGCPDITPKDITPKDITPKDITPKADITPKGKLRTRKLR